MSNTTFFRTRKQGAASIVAALAALILVAQATTAATWKGLEPFVSRRTEVERVLGAPVEDRMSESASLRFNVSGGVVTVFFVTAKFVETKKLDPQLEGTVLQIVLQHERAADTPESMSLVKDKAYQHSSNKEVDVYLNSKEGISYTFVEGKLKTTRYVYASAQLAHLGRKG
ncbi:MAG: hypothetical protein WCD76_22065 [Pyrinomonadaceae bacterium]